MNFKFEIYNFISLFIFNHKHTYAIKENHIFET
jgi:hypothetical protein